MVPKKTTKTVVIKTTKPKAARNERRKAVVVVAKRPIRSKRTSLKQSLRRKFELSFLYPDIIGPLQYPRSGSSDRTVLGMDLTYFYANPGPDNGKVFAFQMGTSYSATGQGVGKEFYADDFEDPIGTGSGTISGLQWPTPTTVEDASLTTGCIVLAWTGPPLNAEGELVFGCGPAIGPLATYNTLLYGPNSDKIPISSLIQKGKIRVPLRHMSPASWTFKDTSDFVEDVETPYVIVYFADNTQMKYLTIEVVRNWEVRPSMGNGSGAIPYDTAGPSFTADANAFQDACADLSQGDINATAGTDKGLMGEIYSYLSSPSVKAKLVKGSVDGLMGMAMGIGPARHHLASLSGGSSFIPGGFVHDELRRTVTAAGPTHETDFANANENNATPKQNLDEHADLISKFKQILSPPPERK